MTSDWSNWDISKARPEAEQAPRLRNATENNNNPRYPPRPFPTQGMLATSNARAPDVAVMRESQRNAPYYPSQLPYHHEAAGTVKNAQNPFATSQASRTPMLPASLTLPNSNAQRSTTQFSQEQGPSHTVLYHSRNINDNGRSSSHSSNGWTESRQSTVIPRPMISRSLITGNSSQSTQLTVNTLSSGVNPNKVYLPSTLSLRLKPLLADLLSDLSDSPSLPCSARLKKPARDDQTTFRDWHIDFEGNIGTVKEAVRRLEEWATSQTGQVHQVHEKQNNRLLERIEIEHHTAESIIPAQHSLQLQKEPRATSSTSIHSPHSFSQTQTASNDVRLFSLVPDQVKVRIPRISTVSLLDSEGPIRVHGDKQRRDDESPYAKENKKTTNAPQNRLNDLKTISFSLTSDMVQILQGSRFVHFQSLRSLIPISIISVDKRNAGTLFIADRRSENLENGRRVVAVLVKILFPDFMPTEEDKAFVLDESSSKLLVEISKKSSHTTKITDLMELVILMVKDYSGQATQQDQSGAAVDPAAIEEVPGSSRETVALPQIEVALGSSIEGQQNSSNDREISNNAPRLDSGWAALIKDTEDILSKGGPSQKQEPLAIVMSAIAEPNELKVTSSSRETDSSPALQVNILHCNDLAKAFSPICGLLSDSLSLQVLRIDSSSLILSDRHQDKISFALIVIRILARILIPGYKTSIAEMKMSASEWMIFGELTENHDLSSKTASTELIATVVQEARNLLNEADAQGIARNPPAIPTPSYHSVHQESPVKVVGWGESENLQESHKLANSGWEDSIKREPPSNFLGKKMAQSGETSQKEDATDSVGNPKASTSSTWSWLSNNRRLARPENSVQWTIPASPLRGRLYGTSARNIHMLQDIIGVHAIFSYASRANYNRNVEPVEICILASPDPILTTTEREKLISSLRVFLGLTHLFAQRDFGPQPRHIHSSLGITWHSLLSTAEIRAITDMRETMAGSRDPSLPGENISRVARMLVSGREYQPASSAQVTQKMLPADKSYRASDLVDSHHIQTKEDIPIQNATSPPDAGFPNPDTTARVKGDEIARADHQIDGMVHANSQTSASTLPKDTQVHLEFATHLGKAPSDSLRSCESASVKPDYSSREYKHTRKISSLASPNKPSKEGLLAITSSRPDDSSASEKTDQQSSNNGWSSALEEAEIHPTGHRTSSVAYSGTFSTGISGTARGVYSPCLPLPRDYMSCGGTVEHPRYHEQAPINSEAALLGAAKLATNSNSIRWTLPDIPACRELLGANCVHLKAIASLTQVYNILLLNNTIHQGEKKRDIVILGSAMEGSGKEDNAKVLTTIRILVGIARCLGEPRLEPKNVDIPLHFGISVENILDSEEIRIVKGIRQRAHVKDGDNTGIALEDVIELARSFVDHEMVGRQANSCFSTRDGYQFSLLGAEERTEDASRNSRYLASPSTSAVKIPIEEKSAEIDDGYLRPDEESQEWHDFTEDWPKLSHIQRKLLLASAYMVVDSVAQLMRNCNMYVPNINYDVGPSASQFEGDEDDIESHGALGAHLLPDDQSRNRTDKDWLTSQESPNVRNWVATVDTEPRSPSNLLTTAYGLMQRGRFPVLPGREDADCVRYKRGMFSALQSTGHLDRVGYEGYRPQIGEQPVFSMSTPRSAHAIRHDIERGDFDLERLGSNTGTYIRMLPQPWNRPIEIYGPSQEGAEAAVRAVAAKIKLYMPNWSFGSRIDSLLEKPSPRDCGFVTSEMQECEPFEPPSNNWLAQSSGEASYIFFVPEGPSLAAVTYEVALGTFRTQGVRISINPVLKGELAIEGPEEKVLRAILRIRDLVRACDGGSDWVPDGDAGDFVRKEDEAADAAHAQKEKVAIEDGDGWDLKEDAVYPLDHSGWEAAFNPRLASTTKDGPLTYQTRPS